MRNQKNGLKMTITNSHFVKEIEAIYAVTSIDKDDGMEGIVFVQDKPNQPTNPLICYSSSELPDLKIEAKKVSQQLNCLTRIIKLSNREEIDRFDGRQ